MLEEKKGVRHEQVRNFRMEDSEYKLTLQFQLVQGQVSTKKDLSIVSESSSLLPWTFRFQVILVWVVN